METRRAASAGGCPLPTGLGLRVVQRAGRVPVDQYRGWLRLHLLSACSSGVQYAGGFCHQLRLSRCRPDVGAPASDLQESQATALISAAKAVASLPTPDMAAARPAATATMAALLDAGASPSARYTRRDP
jgi:hypothetical protein